MLTANDFIKETPNLDAGAKITTVRYAEGGAACICTLPSADASIAAGSLRAPVAGVVGLIGFLIKLHDKGLNTLFDLHGSALRYG